MALRGAQRRQGAMLATAHICLALARRSQVPSVAVATETAERLADAIRDLVWEVSPL